MGSGAILVGARCRNWAAGMAQRREHVFVEAFFTHPLVQAFDEAVLHSLARLDVVAADLSFLLQLERSVAGHFGAISSQEVALFEVMPTRIVPKLRSG